MIEAKVPQDIRKYKTKVLGSFTLRQVICAVVAVVIDIVLIAGVIVPMGLSVNTIVLVVILVDVPVFAFAIEVQGMPMEKFLYKILLRYIRTPAKRKAIYEQKSLAEIKLSDKESKQREKKLKELKARYPEIKEI